VLLSRIRTNIFFLVSCMSQKLFADPTAWNPFTIVSGGASHQQQYQRSSCDSITGNESKREEKKEK
jgi:hypothetical protein